METVFLLWHVKDLKGDDQEMLIGVYSSEDAAKAAIARLKDKPGFVESPGGFLFEPYELNKDHWTEGFVVD